MTKASEERLLRRGKGRPPGDDQAVANLAAALREEGLSARKANDLAIALLEAKESPPTKFPRGTKRRPGSVVVGYEHPIAMFKSRESRLRKKRARGDVVPEPDAVRELRTLLRVARLLAIQKT
jgi:hypothetical protein